MANNKNFKVKNGLSATRYLQSGTAVAASDVDMSSGSYFTKTLSAANTTFTFSNPPTSGTAGSFALEVTGADVLVAYDLSIAAYDNKTLSVTSQDLDIAGVLFKTDGTKMYVLGLVNRAVYQYSLTTAFDLSTASYDSVSFGVSSQEASPQSFSFKPDGTKMYVVGSWTDTVFQYSLSTAWDISTASYDSVSFSVSSQSLVPHGLFFKPDGTNFYICDAFNNQVFQYTLSTAWDLTSSSYTRTFDAATAGTEAYQELTFKPDGTKMYIMDAFNKEVEEYTLSTAWDISTASFVQVFLVTSQDANAKGLTFKPDGTKMYIAGEDTGRIYQYTTGSTVNATITYPYSVKWAGATTPDAPAVGEKDVYTFVTTDGGTTYYGKQAGDAVA